MRAQRIGRAARGSLAGALTTFLALAFHVFGGGASPGAAALGASLLATVWVGILLAGQRLRLWRLALTVAIGQAVLHAAFSTGTASMATAEVAAPVGAGPAAHDHGAVVLGSVLDGGAVLHGGHGMAAAHLAAGIVTVAGILLGDRLITVAIRAAGRLVAAILVALRAPAPAPAAIRRPADAVLVAPLLGRIVATLPRRGPPALAI